MAPGQGLIKLFGGHDGDRVFLRGAHGPQDRSVRMTGDRRDRGRPKKVPADDELAQALLDTMLNTSTDAIIAVDQHQRIRLINRGVEEIFGYSADEIVGRPLDVLLPSRLRAAHRRHVEMFADSPQFDRLTHERRGLVGLRKDGTEFPAEASVAKLETGRGRIFTAILRDITERKRVERALRVSEAQLRDAIESVSDGIILYDADERFVLCNSKYREFYPSIADMLKPGAKIEDMDRASFELGAYQDIAEGIEEWMEMRLRQYRTAQGSHEQHLKDGRWLLCSERRTPSGHIVGIRTDVTEHKRQEASLRESRDQLRLVTDNLPALIVYVDSEERYRFVNATCVSWLARQPEDIIGRRVAEIHGTEYAKFRPHIEAVLGGEAQAYEESVTFPDGITRDIRVSYIPHFGEGSRVKGFSSLAEDITEYRRLEQRQRQSEKMEALGVLAGGIAHDFNNMLFAIIGFTEVVRDDLPEGDERRASLDGVIEAGERARELVRQILAFSRQDGPQPRRVDLYEIADEALRMVRATLPATIELRQTLDEACGSVIADPIQIHQIVMNLAANAADAMKGKPGLLEVALDWVVAYDRLETLSGELQPGSYARLSVRDNGCGMDSRTMDRIFDPFFTTKGVGEGTGMGLSVVHGIVTGLDGAVAVSSEMGRGTAFEIYLPLAEKGTEAAPLVPENQRRALRV